MKTKKTLQKSQWAVLVTIASLLMISISCSSESEDQLPAPPPGSENCEGNTASLAMDIIPIIQQNCAVSGCHVAGTGRANFNIKDNIIQFASQIRTNTQSGFMPPVTSGKSLTEEQKELISCWVANGAKDN